jgi:hypothetical protein
MVLQDFFNFVSAHNFDNRILLTFSPMNLFSDCDIDFYLIEEQGDQRPVLKNWSSGVAQSYTTARPSVVKFAYA